MTPGVRPKTVVLTFVDAAGFPVTNTTKFDPPREGPAPKLKELPPKFAPIGVFGWASTGASARITSILLTGLPVASLAVQLKVIDRSLLRTAVKLPGGGGGGVPDGLPMPGPSIIRLSNCTVPTVACRISCDNPTSISALFAAPAITQVASGTGVHGSVAVAFSKKRKLVEFTLCINSQVSLAKPVCSLPGSRPVCVPVMVYRLERAPAWIFHHSTCVSLPPAGPPSGPIAGLSKRRAITPAALKLRVFIWLIWTAT